MCICSTRTCGSRSPAALGRIFVSPAHHQVHHSGNPKHFNKNFGSCLALWDWMFGTLYVPEKEREPLSFGFPDRADAHTFKGELVDPLDQRRRPSQAAVAETGAARFRLRERKRV